jgi:hypothetical protein
MTVRYPERRDVIPPPWALATHSKLLSANAGYLGPLRLQLKQ